MAIMVIFVTQVVNELKGAQRPKRVQKPAFKQNPFIKRPLSKPKGPILAQSRSYSFFSEIEVNDEVPNQNFDQIIWKVEKFTEEQVKQHALLLQQFMDGINKERKNY